MADALTEEQKRAWDRVPPAGAAELLADEDAFRAAVVDFIAYCNLAGLDPRPSDEAVRAHLGGQAAASADESR